MKSLSAIILAVSCILLTPMTALCQTSVPPSEVESIAEEAFVYGFPLVMNYGVIYESFIDKDSTQYRCPVNQLYNTARVFTPQDTAVVTPNSDTPYSFFCADLRSEPVVIEVPKLEGNRYFSIQLVDLYTFNFGYIGSRTTGRDGGRYMIAGPGWSGETPEGIAKVFRCETQFVFAIIRTQLFNPDDLDEVKRIQAGYRLQPLSAYLKQTTPPAPQAISWLVMDKQKAAENPFDYLNFVLQFCPPVGPASVESDLRKRFASIGIEPGKPFDPNSFTPAQKDALIRGMKRGMAKITKERERFGHEANGWRIATSGIGDRSVYQGDWAFRAVVALAGIYANDPAEAIYPLLAKDSEGNSPDCSQYRYQLTFPAGQLPPVDAFWSITMYDAKTQLLVDNPLHRYLINSPMLPDLKTNPDGSLTIYIQADSPGKDLESNWLPAPRGPIYVAMRLYGPQPSALSGEWLPPLVVRALE